jgi:O-antigen ligase
MLALLCGAVLCLSVLFGGGTHAGFLGDVIVQILSVPLFVAALWTALEPSQCGRRKDRLLLIVGCAVILGIGIQLIPLPFGAWPVERPFAGMDPELISLTPGATWTPLSLAPQATWAAAVSLIAPAAIFLAAIQLSLWHRFVLTWLLLALGAAALLLGFVQVAQGPGSSLRFYTVTNPSESVGLFANRNHFAAHLYVTLVLGAIWFASMAKQLWRPGALNSRSLLWLSGAAVFLVAVVAGLALARSRAGIILAIAALGGILLMLLRQHNAKQAGSVAHRTGTGRLSIVTVLFAVLFAAQFGLGGILSRFESSPIEDLRLPLAETAFETAYKSLPFGTGLGSFVPVYATAEKSKHLLTAYANRAHNDLAEFLLEAGLPGAVLLVAFLTWFLRKAYEVWLKPDLTEHDSQLLLQRSATLIISLLLLHSLADYPLRTTAMSAMFAFFCGILATSAPAPRSEPISQGQREVRERKRSNARPPAEKWGSGVDWPESWRQ